MKLHTISATISLITLNLLTQNVSAGIFDFMKKSNKDYLYIKQNFWEVPKVYDYIVVGAGSAGGMLAMRLANYGFTTLLLEAGSEPEPNSWNITVPAFSTRASEDPKIAWDYFVKHYKEETKLRQEVFYPRASGLGGCSLHHAQIAVYPQKRDFDLLYELTGNDIFKEPLFREKYFKPLENCNYPLQVSDKNDHGYRGWYPTSYSPLVRMLSSDKSLSKLLAFLGGDPTHDVNGYINGNVGTDSVGLFNIPSAVHQTNYTRMNYLGQLQMARAFSPLTILTDTLVSKVIFDKNKKAIGVNVYHGANLYKASPLFDDNRSRQAVPNQFFARNEVIISAGTFNTPQLLMLSGIGDKEELNKFNITTISDLKGVGKNLLDRNEIPYILKLENDLPLFKDCFFSSNEYADRCFRQYKNEKNGAYLANSGVSGEIYKSNKYLNEPDIFIINTPVYFYGYYKGYSEEAVKNTRYFNRLILKAHTRSQGYVKLKSNDPRETPDINLLKFNIGGVEDMNALITSIEYVRNRTREEVGEENVYEEVYPGKQYASRWQIAKWIAEITWGHHVCCTAKLGLDNDPMAVLDSRFRVRGVKGLRVMDMSALPDIPGFFPNLFIHMMGNVLGDFIVEEKLSGEPTYRPKPSQKTLERLLFKEKGPKFNPRDPSFEFFNNFNSDNTNVGLDGQVNIDDPFNKILLKETDQINKDDPFNSIKPQQQNNNNNGATNIPFNRGSQQSIQSFEDPFNGINQQSSNDPFGKFRNKFSSSVNNIKNNFNFG